MELELQVVKSETGVLETNVAMLELYVDEQLQNYLPEFYKGDSDSAKKDRAVLNASQKAISAKRIEIMKRLTAPFLEFETRCKAVEKKIASASSLLDEIVKGKEAEEKEIKRNQCVSLWNSQHFDLFTFDRIYNPKWLNKTYKLSDIEKEMKAIIEKTYSDLKMVERFASTCDLEVDTLKGLYLDCLDIEDVFRRGDELAKNRKRAMQEEYERAERERIELIERQKQEIEQQTRTVSHCMADDEFGITPSWIISLEATEDEILKIKGYIALLGLSCEVQHEELVF